MIAAHLVASAFENEAKDVSTGNAAPQRTPDGVDNIASAVTSSVKEDVHGGSESMITSISDNVHVSWKVDLERIDAVTVKLATILLFLVELMEGVGISFLDSVTVAIGVFSLNLHLKSLVGAEALGVTAIAREHDVERAFTRDVFAEFVESLVELVPEQLSGVIFAGVALLVVALAAAIRVPEGPNPLLGTVAAMRCQIS